MSHSARSESVTEEKRRGEKSLVQGDEVYRLIEHLRGVSESTITAQISRDGIKYYLGAESISKEHIALLHERGVLVELSYTSIMVCPSCGDFAVALIPTCPRCGSSDVVMVELRAHVKCGYIGLSSEFEKEGKLVCPNCGETISNEADLRSYGRIFRCVNCGARFDTPLLKLRCLTCGLLFTVKEAKIMRVPQYKLDKEALGKVEDVLLSELVTSTISEALREITGNFTIEHNVEIAGVSGVNHTMPIRLRIDDREIYIYPVLKEQDVYPLVSALLDLNTSNIVVVLCLEEAARKAKLSCSALSSGKSNVVIVELRSLTELRDKIRSVLLTLLQRGG